MKPHSSYDELEMHFWVYMCGLIIQINSLNVHSAILWGDINVFFSSELQK